MISHALAQEMHEHIGITLEQLTDGLPVSQDTLDQLRHALELASIVVSDSGQRDGAIPLVNRLREYGGEVVHAREEAEPPYSNEYECGLAALEAADFIERLG
jgi:hypothetical protein